MKSKGSEKFRPEYKGRGVSTMYGICCPIDGYQRSKICHNLNTSGAFWAFKCPACKPRAQNIWKLWWPRYGCIMQHSYCHKVQTGKQPKKITLITQRALTKRRWQVGCCWNGFAPSPSRPIRKSTLIVLFLSCAEVRDSELFMIQMQKLSKLV